MPTALKLLRAGLIASLVVPAPAFAILPICPPFCGGFELPPLPPEPQQQQPAASSSAIETEEAKKLLNGSLVPKFPAPPGPTGGLIEFVTPIKYGKSKSCS